VRCGSARKNTLSQLSSPRQASASFSSAAELTSPLDGRPDNQDDDREDPQHEIEKQTFDERQPDRHGRAHSVRPWQTVQFMPGDRNPPERNQDRQGYDRPKPPEQLCSRKTGFVHVFLHCAFLGGESGAKWTETG
jgi:hypothetical protein